ncbi:MAG: transcriptional regulator [Gammaproteobacteria bacterium]|nr:transcriptional regulator [Gammaproteobacteria bacterium]
MDIKPVKTEADYRAALDEIESLMTAEAESADGEKLDIMVTLIEAYEARHFPLDLPDPVEAIKFEMERKGLTIKDLEPMIGKSNRVYEILNHKRSLTLSMIRKLHDNLGIPAESLIRSSQSQS